MTSSGVRPRHLQGVKEAEALDYCKWNSSISKKKFLFKKKKTKNNFTCVQGYLLKSVSFYFFNIQVEAKFFRVHIKSFTVFPGGKLFNKCQRWPATLS